MTKNRAVRDAEKDGNIKPSRQCNQLIYWFFTLNNWTNEERDEISSFCKKNCKKYLFQEEIGEKCGTPHLQGNIMLRKKMRWSEFGLSKRISWEKTRNPKSAFDYCCKAETAVGKVYTNMRIDKSIDKKNFYPWQKLIYDILQDEPDHRKICWIYESTGNTGKSAFVKYMVKNENALMCNGGKCKDLINLVYNADMDLCSTVLWDLPRSNKGKVSYDAIECIKNGMICNTKYETGVKTFAPPHIIIFSNYEPENTDNLSEDRWCKFTINKNLELIDDTKK